MDGEASFTQTGKALSFLICATGEREDIKEQQDRNERSK